MSGGRLTGRRALVTGASRGIGAAVARRLAAEGADVAVVARTAGPRPQIAGSLSDTVATIEASGAHGVPIVADLTDDEARARVLAEAAAGLGGPVEILVNNAAAAIYGPLDELTLRRRRLMFEANVHAPVDLAQQAVPAMRQAGQGWIVNVSSGSARPWDGPPFELGAQGATIAAYGASKAALNRMSNGLAAELWGSGIRVNTVEPRAAVMSEGAAALVGSTLRPDQLETMEQMVQSVLELCCCEAELTGRTCVSLDLLAERSVEVRSLDGSTPWSGA